MLAGNTCTVIVNSNTTGTGTVNVSADVPVSGVTIGVATNGYGAFNISNQKLWILTHVINESGNVDITNGSVAGPVTVHDELLADPVVAGGLVDFTLSEGTCANPGAVVASHPGMVIDATGKAVSTPSDTLNPAVTTSYIYLAHFQGGGGFPAADAACEPFTVDQDRDRQASGLQRFDGGLVEVPGRLVGERGAITSRSRGTTRIPWT